MQFDRLSERVLDRRENEIESKWFFVSASKKEEERAKRKRVGGKGGELNEHTPNRWVLMTIFVGIRIIFTNACAYFRFVIVIIACLLAVVAVFFIFRKPHFESHLQRNFFSLSLRFLVSFNNKNEQLTNSPALWKYFKNKCDSNMKRINEQRLKPKSTYWIWNAIFIHMTLLISIIFFRIRSSVFVLAVLFCFVSAHCLCSPNISFFICDFFSCDWLYLNTTISSLVFHSIFMFCDRLRQINWIWTLFLSLALASCHSYFLFLSLSSRRARPNHFSYHNNNNTECMCV